MDRKEQELAAQKEESRAILDEIAAQGCAPERAVVNFQFVPDGPQADLAGLIAAAAALGYRCDWTPDIGEGEGDDGWLEIAAPEQPLSFATLWADEERLTRLAARHGFAAEGWGFFGS